MPASRRLTLWKGNTSEPRHNIKHKQGARERKRAIRYTGGDVDCILVVVRSIIIQQMTRATIDSISAPHYFVRFRYFEALFRPLD